MGLEQNRVTLGNKHPYKQKGIYLIIPIPHYTLKNLLGINLKIYGASNHQFGHDLRALKKKNLK